MEILIKGAIHIGVCELMRPHNYEILLMISHYLISCSLFPYDIN
jgi:hypothetical protein